MATYKITNLTDTLGKRDNNHNATLKVSYVDGMIRKDIMLEPKNSVFLTIPSLPLSVHKYRMKGLVSVSEVNGKELKDIQLKKKLEKGSVTPPVKSKKAVSTTTTTKKKRTYTKKTTTAKEEESK